MSLEEELYGADAMEHNIPLPPLEKQQTDMILAEVERIKLEKDGHNKKTPVTLIEQQVAEDETPEDINDDDTDEIWVRDENDVEITSANSNTSHLNFKHRTTSGGSQKMHTGTDSIDNFSGEVDKKQKLKSRSLGMNPSYGKRLTKYRPEINNAFEDSNCS